MHGVVLYMHKYALLYNANCDKLITKSIAVSGSPCVVARHEVEVYYPIITSLPRSETSLMFCELLAVRRNTLCARVETENVFFRTSASDHSKDGAA